MYSSSRARSPTRCSFAGDVIGEWAVHLAVARSSLMEEHVSGRCATEARRRIYGGPLS